MKRFIPLVIFFIVSFQLHAQDLSFGAKAGLNLSTVTGDVSDGVNPRLAYHFGGFVNIPLSDKFSLNPELLYFSIGSTFDFALQNFDPFSSNPNTSFTSVERANFLAVPVNFRYNFTNRFGVDFGPQIGFLMNSFSKIKEANNVDPIFVEDMRVSGNFRPDYGANLGLTFSPNEKLNFQLRYYQGLKNLIRGSILPDNKSFNVALQLSAGYIIF